MSVTRFAGSGSVGHAILGFRSASPWATDLHPSGVAIANRQEGFTEGFCAFSAFDHFGEPYLGRCPRLWDSCPSGKGTIFFFLRMLRMGNDCWGWSWPIRRGRRVKGKRVKGKG